MSKTTIVIGRTIDGEKPVHLDIPTLIATRGVITASSGGGKSWLARLIVERAARMVQTIIIDPEREYATLREKLDIALVGEEGEIGLDLRTAGKLARKLMETQISAVLDLFSLNDLEEKREYLAAFIAALMAVPVSLRHPVLFIIDEAHKFAPEGAKSASAAAVVNIMDSGRKRGIGTLILTQRSSKIGKDVIAEAKNVFIGNTTLDLDQDRSGDMLGMHKAERITLRDLDPGTFYAFGPALGKGIFYFKSDQVETTHPKPGERNLVEVPKASAHIQQIVSQIGDLPAQVKAEQDQLTAARTELARVQRELAQRERELKARPVQTQAVPEIREVKVPVLNGELPRLEKAIADLNGFGAQLVEVGKQIAGTGDQVLSAAREVSGALAKWQAAPPRPAAVHAKPFLPTRPNVSLPVPARNAVEAGTEGALTVPQQRILDTLALFESLGIEQPHKSNVAVFSDQSPRSSGYTNNLGALRSRGLVDYPAAGRVLLTDTGRAQANPPTAIKSLADLHAAWFAKLTRPQAAILQVLIPVYPHAMEKAEVAPQAGQSATSSGYTNNLGALHSLGLVTYPKPGYVAASALLFPEGLS